LTENDNHIIKYDLAGDGFTMEADAGGAGSGAFDDTGDPIVQSTEGKEVHVGDGAGTLAGKLEVSWDSATDDANNPILVVEGATSQVDSIIVAQTSADAEVFNVDATGDVLMTSIQDIAGPGTNWSVDTDGNADFTSITFTADTTNPEISYTTSPSTALVFDVDSDGNADITFTATSIDIVGNGTGAQQLELKEDSDNGANIVTFTAPAIITTNLDCQLLDDDDMIPLACIEDDDATANECLLSGGAGGAAAWGTCPSASGGDSISIDSVAVVDPNWVSTGDIDFVDTSNVITANINAAVIDGDNLVASVGGRSLTLDTAATPDEIDADAELYTDTYDIVVESAAGTDDFFFAKAPHALTITDIDCITTGGGTIFIDIYECSGTGTGCVTTDAPVACDGDGAADDGSFSNGAIDAGDWLQFNVTTACDTTCTWTSATVTFTRDD
jgi:hypothetical protein